MHEIAGHALQQVVLEGDHLPVDADPVPCVLVPQRLRIFAFEQAVALGPRLLHDRILRPGIGAETYRWTAGVSRPQASNRFLSFASACSSSGATGGAHHGSQIP